MSVAIKVENLSKAYQLGEIGTGTISRDLERWFARVRGKEDPFLKIGESNDRTTKGESDIVWSLKDINFEISQGDAVGIIGRNGAGKSTLLKLLSRVTSPTTGSVKVKGRVASLLEVGTGFHPELTGRENIFLNGAILGMRKREIASKFEEIVDFSGVERYIDTPVKRYSSGMYVRLAFAVAAHLESEILIVDEVLAVGDSEFQKKCLGKMGELSDKEGKTLLFVSHNLQSVSTLTQKVLLLRNGMVTFDGPSATGIDQYLSTSNKLELEYSDKQQATKPMVSSVKLVTSDIQNFHEFGKPLTIWFEVDFPEEVRSPVFSFQILNSNQVKVTHVLVTFSELEFCNRAGKSRFGCYFPTLRLYPDKYTLTLHLSDHFSKEKLQTLEYICPFEVKIQGEVRDYFWKPGEAVFIDNSEWIK